MNGLEYRSEFQRYRRNLSGKKNSAEAGLTRDTAMLMGRFHLLVMPVAKSFFGDNGETK